MLDKQFHLWNSYNMRRKFIYLFLILLGSFFLFHSEVFAGTTSNVTATVTAQNISVSVADGSIAFGTLGLSSTQDTTTSGVNDSQTATNDGNITENFNIKAGATANWTPAATAGANQYTLKSCTATCDTTPTWTNVGADPSYATLATGVIATSGTSVFDLQVGTPTSSTSYTQQTITVTVQAVAP